MIKSFLKVLIKVPYNRFPSMTFCRFKTGQQFNANITLTEAEESMRDQGSVVKKVRMSHFKVEGEM